MPTTKIISATTPEPQKIDWNKPQFLKLMGSNIIVCSTGVHSGAYFEGWCYVGHDSDSMSFITYWSKGNFSALQGKVQLEISNED